MVYEVSVSVKINSESQNHLDSDVGVSLVYAFFPPNKMAQKAFDSVFEECNKDKLVYLMVTDNYFTRSHAFMLILVILKSEL